MASTPIRRPAQDTEAVNLPGGNDWQVRLLVFDTPGDCTRSFTDCGGVRRGLRM